MYLINIGQLTAGVVQTPYRWETVLTTSLVSPTPAQLSGGHLAAVVSILVLAAFGGALVLKNRVRTRRSSSQPETDDDFVTDREHVRRLIEDNGGRMKQSQIVNSVDWSKAKVSRLLAELEEDGHVTKLRLGRENLVCLPGHEPSASKSPEQPRNE